MHRNSIPSNKSESVLAFFDSSVPCGDLFSFPAPKTPPACKKSRVATAPKAKKQRELLTKTSLDFFSEPLFAEEV
jgi:hypothetical protein